MRNLPNIQYGALATQLILTLGFCTYVATAGAAGASTPPSASSPTTPNTQNTSVNAQQSTEPKYTDKELEEALANLPEDFRDLDRETILAFVKSSQVEVETPSVPVCGIEFVPRLIREDIYVITINGEYIESYPTSNFTDLLDTIKELDKNLSCRYPNDFEAPTCKINTSDKGSVATINGREFSRYFKVKDSANLLKLKTNFMLMDRVGLCQKNVNYKRRKMERLLADPAKSSAFDIWMKRYDSVLKKFKN